MILSRSHLDQMLDAVRQNPDEEVCGIVAGSISGSDYQVELVIPVVNELHSPVRFRMAPQDQLDAFYLIEAQGLELVGIYHSHPNGPSHPSATDISEAYYPEAVQIIWSRESGHWNYAAYIIQDDLVGEVKLSVISD